MTISEVHQLGPTLNADQVADLLGIGRNQAYAAAKSGELPNVRIGGRVLFLTAPLLEMLGVGPPGHEESPGVNRGLPSLSGRIDKGESNRTEALP